MGFFDLFKKEKTAASTAAPMNFDSAIPSQSAQTTDTSTFFGNLSTNQAAPVEPSTQPTNQVIAPAETPAPTPAPIENNFFAQTESTQPITAPIEPPTNPFFTQNEPLATAPTEASLPVETAPELPAVENSFLPAETSALPTEIEIAPSELPAMPPVTMPEVAPESFLSQVDATTSIPATTPAMEHEMAPIIPSVPAVPIEPPIQPETQFATPPAEELATEETPVQTSAPIGAAPSSNPFDAIAAAPQAQPDPTDQPQQ